MGALLRVLGFQYYAVRLTGVGLTISGGHIGELLFEEISKPVVVTKKLGLTAISIPTKTGELMVVGLRRSTAADFVSVTNTNWRSHFTQQIDVLEEELRALGKVVERLECPNRFPSACLLDPYVIRTNQLLENLPDSIPANILPSEQQALLDKVSKFGASMDCYCVQVDNIHINKGLYGRLWLCLDV